MDVSDIFYSFCSGEGKGKSGGKEGGRARFFIENLTRGGGGSPKKGGGARGREGVCGEFGGGVNNFFGAEMSTKK